MSDFPILFSVPMVRALMAGTKTQTRRILNPQPTSHVWRHGWERGKGATWSDETTTGKIKYWAGDRLYVREPWRVSNKWDGHSPAHSHKGKPVIPARQLTVFFEAGGSIANQAANDNLTVWRPDAWPAIGALPDWAGKVRQAMHLPRWGSRITLFVDDVKVERLQDCSEEDAIAEGIERHHSGWMPYSTAFYEQDGKTPANHHEDPRESYRSLWNKINGSGAWERNPWIVAYTFRVVVANIDYIEKAAA